MWNDEEKKEGKNENIWSSTINMYFSTSYTLSTEQTNNIVFGPKMTRLKKRISEKDNTAEKICTEMLQKLGTELIKLIEK